MPLAAYCYLRAVGRGSYGEVTLVRHRRDGRQYVIKKLNLRNASSRERRAAEQEAQLLSQLKHPNIVTYKESWEGGDGLLYIVMGFCEGGDLYRKLKEQKGQLLPESQVVEWFVQIAMALQYLHEKHILHRDLKTQNVFLTRTNIIKVGDLGIARVLENQCDMASTLIGTPYYMSPELFSNKPYNYKSDVWALGCCVYEMATLKHAFNAKDMNSLVYRIIEGKLPPMPKDYSPELAELIRTMLSRRPEERPSVRSVLRQPYIKRQISLFLEATKAKTSKNNVKNGESKSKHVPVVSRKAESNHEVIAPQPHSSDGSKTHMMGEDNCLPHEKPLVVDPLKTHASLKGHPCKPDMSNTAKSLATVSRVNINILPAERRDSESDALVGKTQPRHVDPSNEVEGKCSIPRVKEERLQDNNKSSVQLENLIPSRSLDDAGNDPVKPPLSLSKDQKPLDQLTCLDGCDPEDQEAHDLDVEVDGQDEENEVEEDEDKEDEYEDFDMEEDEDIDGEEDEEKPVGRKKNLAMMQNLMKMRMKMKRRKKDPVAGEYIIENQDRIYPGLQPHSSESEPSLSRQRRQKKREPTEDSRANRQVGEDLFGFQEVSPRRLSSHPTAEKVDVILTKKDAENQSRAVSAFMSTSSSSEVSSSKDRPLSARERRRLKQSQEEIFPSGPSVRRASLSAVRPGKPQEEGPPLPARRVSSDYTVAQEKKLRHCLSEEECSSSTSSTDKSDGDSRERKGHTNEMNDLVKLMTQTLKLDSKESCEDLLAPIPVSEFKLHRKYRDTLLLHGKVAEEAEGLHFKELPSAVVPGSEKIRRIVEVLRSDVIQGLGIQLLEQVYDILEVEDELEREVRLQEHMGEKYMTYSVKARQLKFFEENVNF
ncbi:PREDICTED: serine/threonine-protein kinase Nek4 [Chrysochloris asiatica]|uniref:Serine/threonine-protein kinase Nek4 n=1 Tax=Chrysochloris asiatica TaxID=185453 RepID=A0A9B0U858_CHRAS|nr:PREDICTED: serine/threonine-protein kinase Nek4 [Chrysochloris asiatica]